MEAQDRAGLAADLVLVVGGEQEGGHGPRLAPAGRLDDVGDVPAAGGLVEVLQLLARVLGVLGEVVVRPLRDALQLAPTPRGTGTRRRRCRPSSGTARRRRAAGGGASRPGCPGRRTRPCARAHQYSYQRGPSSGGTKNSSSICSNSRVRKMKFAGADLVAEALADLGDAEGRLLAAGLQHVGEVHEHALRRLGPQVDLGALALDRAGVGLEHEVERPGLGEAVLGVAVRAHPGIVQVVLAEAVLAHPAVDERIGEVGQVAGRLPDGRRAEDGGVDAGRCRPGAAPSSGSTRPSRCAA